MPVLSFGEYAEYGSYGLNELCKDNDGDDDADADADADTDAEDGEVDLNDTFLKCLKAPASDTDFLAAGIV